MDNIININKLKEQIEAEMKKDVPNQELIKRLRSKIAHLGIGLDYRNFFQKPFTHV